MSGTCHPAVKWDVSAGCSPGLDTTLAEAPERREVSPIMAIPYYTIPYTSPGRHHLIEYVVSGLHLGLLYIQVGDEMTCLGLRVPNGKQGRLEKTCYPKVFKEGKDFFRRLKMTFLVC